MLRHLFKRFRHEPKPSGPAINLYGDASEPLEALPPIGLVSTTPQCSAWTAARLERILRRCSAQPDHAASLLEGRHARHCLSSFWLTAPVDQLEPLYRGPIGQAYREMLLGPLPRIALASDEQSWKDALAARLQQSFETPERTNLLLAVMPYCAPGRMRLQDPHADLPPWLLADYSRCFDPDLALPVEQPIGLLGQPNMAVAAPAPASLISTAPLQDAIPSPQSLAPLPQLSDRRGTEAFALFQESEFCERMRGLINLFRLDPNDGHIRAELSQLRRLIGQVWLDVTPSSLESLYRSPMGEVYRQLLASNFGGVPCEGEDLQLRQGLDQVAINEAHPAMAQALLAVMPFHPQGKMRLGPGKARLPLWLQEEFARLSGLHPEF